jgi:hypothetical protein
MCDCTDALEAAEGAEARVAELRDDMYEALARLESALKAYAEGAKVGVFSAREALLAELNR